MESLLTSIALKYGKGKLTDMGLNYAAKLLGIDQQQQNPKYTFGMPFTDGNISLNPMNMLKKSAFNTGIKSLISGGAIAPLTLGAGAIYLLNKNRKKLTGYDTQSAYEAARDQRIADKRLDKITDRITSGKDYGNYGEALLDSSAGAVEIDGIIDHGANFGFETESNDNAGNNGSTGSTGSTGSKSSGGHSGSGYQGASGSHHYRRGGIASL